MYVHQRTMSRLGSLLVVEVSKVPHNTNKYPWILQSQIQWLTKQITNIRYCALHIPSGGGAGSGTTGGAGGGLVGGNGLTFTSFGASSMNVCPAVTGGTQTTGGTSSAGSGCGGSLYQGGGCSIFDLPGGGGGYYGGAGGHSLTHSVVAEPFRLVLLLI